MHYLIKFSCHIKSQQFSKTRVQIFHTVELPCLGNDRPQGGIEWDFTCKALALLNGMVGYHIHWHMSETTHTHSETTHTQCFCQHHVKLYRLKQIVYLWLRTTQLKQNSHNNKHQPPLRKYSIQAHILYLHTLYINLIALLYTFTCSFSNWNQHELCLDEAHSF